MCQQSQDSQKAYKGWKIRGLFFFLVGNRMISANTVNHIKKTHLVRSKTSAGTCVLVFLWCPPCWASRIRTSDHDAVANAVNTICKLKEAKHHIDFKYYHLLTQFFSLQSGKQCAISTKMDEEFLKSHINSKTSFAFRICTLKQTYRGSPAASTNRTSWLSVSAPRWGSLPRRVMMERS